MEMNDLISRSYILNIIEMWMKVPSYSESERNIMRAIDYEARSAPSADPWKTVKKILDELEWENEKLLVDYCDTTARVKAIRKIAESGQTPKQKIDGIKPLAEMGVTESEGKE
jgi:hypothetical protein